MHSHQGFTPAYRLAAFALLALGVVVTNGCDALNTTRSACYPRAGLARHDEKGSALLGSTTIPWTARQPLLFGTAPTNQWVIVRASGEWTAVVNPACGGQPPEFPCNTGIPPFDDFDPDYPDAFRGPVLVKTGHDGTIGDLPMRGLGGGEGIALTKREFRA
jgi:hypothetical protein